MSPLEALHSGGTLSIVPLVDKVGLSVTAVGTVRSDNEGIERHPVSGLQTQVEVASR